MEFDVAATFNDDYLYFYEDSIDDGHSDDDTAEVLGLLDLPAGARLLDAPCGHGRISRRLAAAGMHVTGVDASEEFLRMAASSPTPTGSGGSTRYLHGDVRQLPAEVEVDGPFDAVVCWYASFGYWDDDDCHRVLCEFRRVLRPGGVLVIESMHHDGSVRHFTPEPDAVVVTRGDDAQLDRYRWDPLTGRMECARTIHRDGQVRRSTHFMRLPTPPEWVTWLDAAGFSNVSFTAGGGGPLDLDSWVIVVRATAR
ncbi:MAG TPA: methyltransferase domain-containing protein [Acidimicrobiales bacterium]|jgi:ubiquinone/menaquinone biosynthesis C-methylase UbiE